MNLLSWITRAVKNAVIRGFAEAADELEMNQDADADHDALESLRGRMAAIPGPDDKPIRKGK